MIFRFEEFELDRIKGELCRAGEAIDMEPQVFALLLLLVENRERLVSRDELIEKVWDGRAVSDSALDSRIKSARRALGDDGKEQRFIRTLRGRGFRFVADVREAAPAIVAARPPPEESGSEEAPRPSIAVLPLRAVGSDEVGGAVADALADELIAELARLRWLFVIARGSSFRFRAADNDPQEVGRLLGVRYVLGGTVQTRASSLTVTVELVDTRDSSVVWGDRYTSEIVDVHDTRTSIVARIVAALALQIPTHEAQRARLTSPANLDAWSAYHLGLQHMFRFNRRDNAVAGEMFSNALAKDPHFARAHAGLSFVHFQNAFLGYTRDVPAEAFSARRHAEHGIEIDPLDPFVNLTMGRSFWLSGDLDGGLGWLDRATALSPSYAQAVYARAWTHALAGRGSDGRSDADAAMALSPLDPLYYAMAATRALSHIALGEDAEAATWADKAARSPGAHVLIAVIAAAAHSLSGDDARAAAWAANARERNPALTKADFFRSFPFAAPAVKRRIEGALTIL